MALLRDQEFRTYTMIVVVATLLLTYVLLPFNRDPTQEYLTAETSLRVLVDAPPMAVLRQAAFQVLTILTTAGFATDDFNLWNDQARTILLALMFIGGSAGSAGGGPKVVRAILIFKYAAVELLRVLHPQAVTAVRYNGKVVPNKVLRAIVAFLLLYLLVFAVSVLALSTLGSDLITSITASIATLGNIGPGYSIVGPMGSYASLPFLSKVVLFLNMWIGRLEVITVLVFLQPAVWRAARLDD
jgi:trk system potassium uptake protein TrkH